MPLRLASSISLGITVPYGHSLSSTIVMSVRLCGGVVSVIGPYPRSNANTALKITDINSVYANIISSVGNQTCSAVGNKFAPLGSTRSQYAGRKGTI